MKNWTIEQALNFAGGYWHAISLSKPFKGEIDPSINVKKTFLHNKREHPVGWDADMTEAIEAIDPAICDAMLANEMVVKGVDTIDWTGTLSFVQPDSRAEVAHYVIGHLKKIDPKENVRNLMAVAHQFGHLKMEAPKWLIPELTAEVFVLESKERTKRNVAIVEGANEWLFEYYAQFDPKKKK